MTCFWSLKTGVKSVTWVNMMHQHGNGLVETTHMSQLVHQHNLTMTLDLQIIVFDHDGGDMKDFKVNTSKLLNGPGESSHKLRVTITVDFSNYRRTNADFDFATPVFFLTGYKLDGVHNAS